MSLSHGQPVVTFGIENEGRGNLRGLTTITILAIVESRELVAMAATCYSAIRWIDAIIDDATWRIPSRVGSDPRTTDNRDIVKGLARVQ